jgi:hypothetical protein
MTGRSLLTGAALPKNSPAHGVLGNTAQAFATGIPQARLIKEIIKPTKPTTLYRHDWQTQIASLLGVPVKKTSLAAAARLAAEEGKPRR